MARQNVTSKITKGFDQTPQHKIAPMPYVYRAYVKENNDSQFMGRLRVYIPEFFLKKHSLNKEIFNLKKSHVNFFNLVHEIVEKVEIMLVKSSKGLKMIKPWGLRKETLIILNIAKRLCYLLSINDVLRKNVKLSRIDLIFCFIKGIMT